MTMKPSSIKKLNKKTEPRRSLTQQHFQYLGTEKRLHYQVWEVPKTHFHLNKYSF